MNITHGGNAKLVVGMLTLGFTLAVAGVDRSPASAGVVGDPPLSPAAAPGGSPDPALIPAADARPNSEQSGYADVAVNLADPLLVDVSGPVWTKEFAQLMAEANIRIARYGSSKAVDPVLKRTAEEASAAGADFIQRSQAVWEMSGNDDFRPLVIGMLGLLLGERGAFINAANDSLKGREDIHRERNRLALAFNRTRAAQLMLPESARTMAGPAAEPGSVLAIDFDESFAGSAPFDQIALTNRTGKVLNHCTVLVELHGASGESRQNVHYVASWGPGVRRFAQYGIGVESDAGVFGRRTVMGVQELRVSVWSDETRDENFLYRYVGDERDRDIRAALDGRMVVRFRYIPVTPWQWYPQVLLVLEGITMIPAHQVHLQLRPREPSSDQEPLSVESEQPAWSEGDGRIISLTAGHLKDPGSMDIVIQFPGVNNYKYIRTVEIPKP